MRSTALQRTDPELRRRPRYGPWIALAVAALAVLGWSVNSLLSDSVVYYRTPAELLARPAHDVRVAGTLVAGSIRETAPGTTRFRVSDGQAALDVEYTGPPSTALTTGSQPGAKLVAQGSMGVDHVFRAESLLAKCPSKFSAAS